MFKNSNRVILALSFGALLLTGCGESEESRDVSTRVDDSNLQPSVDLQGQFVATSSSHRRQTLALKWTTENVEECTATGGWSGGKGKSGKTLINSGNTNKEYSLECTSDEGTVSDTIDFTDSQVTPTVTLVSDISIISPGDSATLSWNANYVDRCRAAGNWSGGNKSTSGSETITEIQSDSLFEIICNGESGEVSDAVFVLVDTTPAVASPISVSMTAEPNHVDYNGSTTLRWASSNADACSAVGDWTGQLQLSGSMEISGLTSDSEFSINCTRETGRSVASVLVTVNDPISEPVLTFWANSTEVLYGEDVTLYWSSSNTTSCTADGHWTGTKPMSGQETISSLVENSNFQISCFGDGAVVTGQLTIQVQVANTGAVSLSWAAPTHNVDGTVFENPSGYIVYYGNFPRNYTKKISLDSPAITSHFIGNLYPDEWYFSVTAESATGRESDNSSEVSGIIE